MEKESSYLPKKMAGFRMIKVCLDRHSGMLGVRVVGTRSDGKEVTYDPIIIRYKTISKKHQNPCHRGASMCGRVV
jgi:hypothetical protein